MNVLIYFQSSVLYFYHPQRVTHKLVLVGTAQFRMLSNFGDFESV